MFYAVAKGRQIGVFNTWAECESQVKDFQSPKFKKFQTRNEALAFISENTKQTFCKVGNDNKRVAPISSHHSKTSGTENDTIKEQVLSLKATLNAMREKFDKFVEQQKADFESINDNLDVVLLATNGNSSPPGFYNKYVNDGSPPPRKKSKSAILLDKLPESGVTSVTNSRGLKIDEAGYVHVYTDGACSNNGQAGARAGYGIWWAKDHELNRSELAVRNTNNAAEIQAVTEAIKLAKSHDMKKLKIHTDSNFLIDCVTKWMKNWKKNGWMTTKNEPVKNRAELEALDEAIRQSPPLQIKYQHVSGHSGILGNEEADALARKGAQK